MWASFPGVALRVCLTCPSARSRGRHSGSAPQSPGWPQAWRRAPLASDHASQSALRATQKWHRVPAVTTLWFFFSPEPPTSHVETELHEIRGGRALVFWAQAYQPDCFWAQGALHPETLTGRVWTHQRPPSRSPTLPVSPPGPAGAIPAHMLPLLRFSPPPSQRTLHLPPRWASLHAVPLTLPSPHSRGLWLVPAPGRTVV